MGKQKPEPYPAALCAAVHTGNSGDSAFYLQVCTSATNVLELGCGDGRIGKLLVQAGIEVVGLDLDEAALKIAETHGLSAVAADFTCFDLEQRFDRIIIPYNGFYCLLSETAMVSCLRSIERHLKPDGMLILDIFCVDHLPIQADDDGVPGTDEWVACIDFESRGWDVFERSVIHYESQRIDATYTHVPEDDATPIVATVQSRFLRSHEIAGLLAQAGLMLSALNGGFADEPYHPDAQILVVRATRSCD